MKSLASIALVLSLSALCAGTELQGNNPNKRVVVRTTAMSSAAAAWLAALPEELRQRANQPFDSEVRKVWGYMGGSRSGVTLGEQNPEERRLLDLLLREGLSPTGYLKVHAIASLEEVQKGDPNAYFTTVFGDPAGDEPWAWRFEGHHVSLNFTLKNGDFVTATPLFLGADPARVGDGPRTGLELFYPEEALMRDLLASLPEGARLHGVRRGATPDDVLLGPGKDEHFKEREGAPAGQMFGAPQQYFMRLLNLTASMLQEDLAFESMSRYRHRDLRDLDFVWSGKGVPGEAFYYRIQGLKKGFSVEYVNRGNHVHCLWRDFGQDFGAGPLSGAPDPGDDGDGGDGADGGDGD